MTTDAALALYPGLLGVRTLLKVEEIPPFKARVSDKLKVALSSRFPSIFATSRNFHGSEKLKTAPLQGRGIYHRIDAREVLSRYAPNLGTQDPVEYPGHFCTLLFIIPERSIALGGDVSRTCVMGTDLQE